MANQAPKPRPRRNRTSGDDPSSEAAEPRPPTAGKKTVLKKVTVKKKVAKKKKKLTKTQQLKEDWQPGRVEQTSSVFVKEIIARLRKETGDTDIVLVGTDPVLCIGIPLPSFCLEYLFGMSVYPLGRVVQVVGPEASMKSSFLFEITRWFKDYCEGHAFALEGESKLSESMARAIIGWHYECAIAHVPCYSVNDWQRYMQAIFKHIKLQMLGTKKNRGPGMKYPVHMTVDSIMGKSMQESQDRIENKGFADRDHAIEAQSITKFLRKIPQDITKWPFAITVVNHLKCDKDDRGFLIRNKAGGKGMNFQETFEIEMARFKRQTFKDYEMLRLRMKCAKSSLGTDQRWITVDVLFWDEPADPDKPAGVWRQKTVFNWFGATINLLLTMKDQEKQRWKGDKDLGDPGALDLTEVSRGALGKGVWSKKLGIPKSDPVSFAVAGQILQENPEVLTDLRHRFSVKIEPEFQPGVDYRIQRGRVKKEIREKLR